MNIQKGDFIQVEYTGRTADDNEIFDTTDEALAKEHDAHAEHATYGPITICVGEGHLLPGLEQQLIGREIGEYDIILSPEQGFGKKDAKLLRMIPASAFQKQQIAPYPGLHINIDGVLGVVKTAGGGRTIVDFNHPLAGRELKYLVKIIAKVDDKQQQLAALYEGMFRAPRESYQIAVTGNQATITTIPIPQQLQQQFAEKAEARTGITVLFAEEKQQRRQPAEPPASSALS
ncbi:peptidylprolyl isomerase [Candidatus Woesearchaeota archaeon]|nr:peptidylprolyl isomerase [Candidatus Woesearchaeota archaeon]